MFYQSGTHQSFLAKQITSKSNNTQRNRVTESPPDFLIAIEE
jgi:hypothetical protein